MKSYTLYVDLLFVTNFVLDFILLYATAKFGNFKSSKWRILLGAFVGGVYGVLMVYPRFLFMQGFFYKVIVSIIIVKLSFNKLNSKQLLSAVGYFYLISFAMAGAVIGGTALISTNGMENTDYRYTVAALFFALVVSLILSRYGVIYIKKNFRKNEYQGVIDIYISGNKVTVNSLMDTGNELIDPVSRLPVMIVEYNALVDIFPDRFKSLCLQYGKNDVSRILSNMIDEPLSRRMRLIPFNSIGATNGLMLGIKADCVVYHDAKPKVVNDVILAIYFNKIYSQVECNSIVNPAIFDCA